MVTENHVLEISPEQKKCISLVLGSGGARGLAHIGIIKWLVENNYQIKSISGCSIGALIGGVFAAGKLDEFEQWVCGLSKLDIISLLDLSWSTSGLLRGDKIIDTLFKLLGDQTIEALPLQFTAVAADIKNEKEVWINSGCLFDAIRASISLPLFFTPVERKGVQLIDGGVLNPVPIAPTFSDNTDFTVAVNLGGVIDLDRVEPDTLIDVVDSIEDLPLQQKIGHYIKQFGDNLALTSSKPPTWKAYDVADQAFDAMQSTIARLKLAAYPADYNIVIPRNACGTLEFDRAKEMIALGYQSAHKALHLDTI
ncbi:patatin-like phospholipase family protein [Psychromonas sp. SR45-3]|uniref:patatin-like phospholipase family protein n=1 Tax=Psychromonas sp. SR45-3 TaxID=2760930 RepID=UPI0015FE1459|nr:patatin-like phospholipase family protein [Psychromonas sp. SR45-3]MBB1272327.1 patatin-like phospholipase family protein [Psychromonas sp. SR45-3]